MANKLETLIENVNALVEAEDADGAPTEAVYLLDKVIDLDNQVDDAIAKYEELNG